jgi:hypothetical protein
LSGFCKCISEDTLINIFDSFKEQADDPPSSGRITPLEGKMARKTENPVYQSGVSPVHFEKIHVEILWRVLQDEWVSVDLARDHLAKLPLSLLEPEELILMLADLGELETGIADDGRIVIRRAVK